MVGIRESFSRNAQATRREVKQRMVETWTEQRRAISRGGRPEQIQCSPFHMDLWRDFRLACVCSDAYPSDLNLKARINDSISMNNNWWAQWNICLCETLYTACIFLSLIFQSFVIRCCILIIQFSFPAIPLFSPPLCNLCTMRELHVLPPLMVASATEIASTDPFWSR